MKLESLNSSKFEALQPRQMAQVIGGAAAAVPQSTGFTFTSCRTGDDNGHQDEDTDKAGLYYHESIETGRVVDLRLYYIEG